MKTKSALYFVVLLVIPMARSATVPVSPTPLVTITAATPDNLPGLDVDTVRKFHPNTFLVCGS